MRLLTTLLVSVWACIYTGSLSWAVWKRGNHRGGFFTALLALAVLVVPMVVELFVTRE